MTRRRAAPEEALQRACVQWLRWAIPDGAPFWWTHIRNEAKRSVVEGKRAKDMGMTPGAPDLVLCVDGRFVGVELKVGRRPVTDNQALAHKEIWEAGGAVYLVRSLEDLQRVIRDELGMPTREVTMRGEQ